jgi:hypothetical protein
MLQERRQNATKTRPEGYHNTTRMRPGYYQADTSILPEWYQLATPTVWALRLYDQNAAWMVPECCQHATVAISRVPLVTALYQSH